MMFKIIFLILLRLTHAGQCPVKGDGPARLWHIDSTKNIQDCPDPLQAAEANIKDLMADKLGLGQFVYVDCYIVSAKLSGPESCQCHSKNLDDLDYHIYVSDKPTALKKDCAIVEVSRYSRIYNPGLTLEYVKSLVGQSVKVYGYVFSDTEHKSAIGNWRSGIEEIHPVFYIQKN
jgi:hypothetical protein